MKIFIDSADLDQILKARSYGVLDGVTTNPSLIKKAVTKLQEAGEKIDIKEYINKLLYEVGESSPVSLEVIGSDYEQMVQEARILHKTFNHVANNVYVKIPADPAFTEDSETHFDGIKAIKTLTSEGIRVNCTLIFTPEQALLAAKAGASFVSPFAGRVDDMLRKKNNIEFSKDDYFPAHGLIEEVDFPDDNGIISGIDLVQQCVDILESYELKSQVLAASLRNPRQVRESALAGAHIATLPFGVIEDLLKHEKTMEGMELFTKDIIPEYAQLFK